MATKKPSKQAKREPRVNLISVVDYPLTVDLKGDDDIIVSARSTVEGVVKSNIISVPKGIRVVGA